MSFATVTLAHVEYDVGWLNTYADMSLGAQIRGGPIGLYQLYYDADDGGVIPEMELRYADWQPVARQPITGDQTIAIIMRDCIDATPDGFDKRAVVVLVEWEERRIIVALTESSEWSELRGMLCRALVLASERMAAVLTDLGCRIDDYPPKVFTARYLPEERLALVIETVIGRHGSIKMPGYHPMEKAVFHYNMSPDTLRRNTPVIIDGLQENTDLNGCIAVVLQVENESGPMPRIPVRVVPEGASPGHAVMLVPRENLTTVRRVVMIQIDETHPDLPALRTYDS